MAKKPKPNKRAPRPPAKPPKPPPERAPRPTPGVSEAWTLEELGPPPEGKEWVLQSHGGAVLVTKPTPGSESTGGNETGTGGGTGSGSGSYTPPPPPPPTPLNTWDTTTTYVAPTGIKQASPDIVVFDEEIDPDFLVQAFFQEFGGTELINISRSDLINGDSVSYSPIVNLSSIRQNFNPNNIIAIGAFQEAPTRYGIDLFGRGVIKPYFNEDGDLVVEIEDVRPDESIEVEIASDGTISRIEL